MRDNTPLLSGSAVDLDLSGLRNGFRPEDTVSDQAGLLAAVKHRAPGLCFSLARRGSRWYRLGGVLDAREQPVSGDLNAWATAELERIDGDLEGLLECYRGRGYSATRIEGRQLFLVAPFGHGPAEFVQLEVEESVEVIHRSLIIDDHVPADLDEFIDPPHSHHHAPRPLGPPRYTLRRVTRVDRFVAEMDRHALGVTPLHRLLDDWGRSSAGKEPFCRHYVLRLRDDTGIHGERHLGGLPLSCARTRVSPVSVTAQAPAVELMATLRHVDYLAGHPFAWFFIMLWSDVIAPALVDALQRHLAQGYRYLPEADIAVLEDWMAAPYYLREVRPHVANPPMSLMPHLNNKNKYKKQ